MPRGDEVRALCNFYAFFYLANVRSRIRFEAPTKAIDIALRCSKKFPKNPSARILLADAYLFGGEVKNAEKHYKQAMEILQDQSIPDHYYLVVYVKHRLFEAEFLSGEHRSIVKMQIIEQIDGFALHSQTRMLFRLNPYVMEVPRPFIGREELRLLQEQS